MIDVAVAAIRGFVFVAVLQAAGAAMFRSTTRPSPAGLDLSIRHVIVLASLLAIVGTVIRSVLEPSRMAGSVSGATDRFLWSLYWQSDVATAQTSRLVGAGLLLVATLSRQQGARFGQWLGIGLVIASFAMMGHTRTHAPAWLLGSLLAMHVAAAAFWFGALLPLLLVLRQAGAEEALRMLEGFSSRAVRVVAVLSVAGILLGYLLLASFAGLASPYGQLVLLKAGLLTALLGLAAANRYRWMPRLALAGERGRLQQFIAAEIALIVCVLAATATMTTLHSPD